MEEQRFPSFKKVPYTGVIYVMKCAEQHGYTASDPNWSNLGQGAPQTDDLPGGRAKPFSLADLDLSKKDYSPISGERKVREIVANYYNHLFRKNKKSKYTWENVSIAGGCRVLLTRIVASIGNINLGHFLPDYTAYEELLSIFKSFIAIPIAHDHLNQYQKSLGQIEEEIVGRGLQALLMSNPCNPTGQLLRGEVLQRLVDLGRQYNTTLIMDEAYSHYIYSDKEKEDPEIVSASEYVDDVNSDPVIVVDGLTKNWRLPGWRIGWAVGPKELIDSFGSAGSFLDGGPNTPLQTVIHKLLDIDYVLSDAKELQQYFRQKRDYALKRLYNLGLRVETEPRGAFYIWTNLAYLPDSINDGMKFFEAGLREKVITVPGIFFDVNPEKRRSNAKYSHYCRISFGPSFEELKVGLDAIERVIEKNR